MNKNLLIFGGKSTALEIRESAIAHYSSDFSNVLLVIPDNEKLDHDYEYVFDRDISEFIKDNVCQYIVGFTNHNGRKKIQQIMHTLKVEPVNILHPSAIISKSVTIGIGNYIAAGSIISHNARIHNHCIINYHVTIGHDTLIKSNAIILPGSRISGNTIIGERVLIGANSFIFQGKSIGNDCVIDAMTYVSNDLEDFHICSSRNSKKFRRVK